MRISTIKEDRGYTPLSHLLLVAVLDVGLMKAVVTADTDEGFVICYKLNCEGRPVLASNGREYELVKTTGTVVIDFHPKAPLLDEDRALGVEAFLKKFMPQREVERYRARSALH